MHDVRPTFAGYAAVLDPFPFHGMCSRHTAARWHRSLDYETIFASDKDGRYRQVGFTRAYGEEQLAQPPGCRGPTAVIYSYYVLTSSLLTGTHRNATDIDLVRGNEGWCSCSHLPHSSPSSFSCPHFSLPFPSLSHFLTINHNPSQTTRQYNQSLQTTMSTPNQSPSPTLAIIGCGTSLPPFLPPSLLHHPEI